MSRAPSHWPFNTDTSLEEMIVLGTEAQALKRKAPIKRQSKEVVRILFIVYPPFLKIFVSTASPCSLEQIPIDHSILD
jgi:hypothetical protein